jgi:F420-dependent methylenetetrahydromethanopterin dehydrogenase
MIREVEIEEVENAETTAEAVAAAVIAEAVAAVTVEEAAVVVAVDSAVETTEEVNEHLGSYIPR